MTKKELTFTEFSSRGGKKRAKNLSKAERVEIAKTASVEAQKARQKFSPAKRKRIALKAWETRRNRANIKK